MITATRKDFAPIVSMLRKTQPTFIIFVCLLFLSGCSNYKSAQSLLDDDKRAATYPSAAVDLMPLSEESKRSNRTKFCEDGSGLVGMKKSDLSMLLGDADELGFQCAWLVFAEENCARDKYQHHMDAALRAVGHKYSRKSEKSWLAAIARPAKQLLYSMSLEYVRIYWLHDGNSRALGTHALAVSMLNNRVIRSSACWSVGPIDDELGLTVCLLMVCCSIVILKIWRHFTEKKDQTPQNAAGR